MHFQFSFKNMNSSPSLQAYAEQKLKEKIAKFVSKPIAAHIGFSAVRHQHSLHLSLEAGDGLSVQVEHTSDGDPQALVDEVVEKLTNKLRRQKEKLKDHKGLKLTDKLETIRGEAPLAEGPDQVDAEPIDAGDIAKFEQKKRRTGR